eukprot:TRINITY_DN490_c1_g1_i2.p2 TRINITY_DN490_c1_g1~~TRINITY_DN490_c1_g1_i2.p2  ORF type:complete len:171 (-),score=45.37 TRINITY_DN490_c1_g1_i2:1269-1781(-)
MNLDDEDDEGDDKKNQQVILNQQGEEKKDNGTGEGVAQQDEEEEEEQELYPSRLFRGYVSCQQITEVMQEDGDLKPGQMIRKIKMHGPGRVGLAEVAVTQIVSKREKQEKSDKKKKSGVVKLLGGGAKLLASILLGDSSESVLDTQFRCCLMTLTAPVDDLAIQILSNLY